ncbi:serine hydrolase-like protein 2 isoform X3 [Pteronotus mesoamericanus]|uniref:serine hydrolase-like protein 2 isoform X3 n=1 Tax=Pteronotus mesoamericanus TaxID=1884717 RepID=UPI0023EC77C7|nr:serine hydrolase-like protein 2 isoform X3 [Pteronotus parnellii mesoamericanus]
MDLYYVAMDFRGHGLSSHFGPGLCCHFQNFVSETRRVVEALKWKRFSILGHSFGGFVGGMFSCVFPEMVDELIMLDSLPFALDTNEVDNLLTYKRKAIEHTLQLDAAAKKPPRVLSLEETLQRLLKANTQLGEECGKILLQRGTTRVATGVVMNRDRRMDLLEHCMEFVSRERAVLFIKKLQARVLLIKALQGYYDVRRENDNKKEPVVFMVDTLKSVLKERFQYVEVPGNHYVHMQQPNRVAGVVSSFLESEDRLQAQLEPLASATQTPSSQGP